MASVLKVKRSSSANAPSSLHTGEIAITFGAGLQTNSGDRVFIGGMGAGDNLNSTTAAPIIVGGKYFTDMMDHVKGELTASSAIIADANSKINNLKVDNIDLNDNTISTTDTNGNLDLNPNGSGKVRIANTWTIPRSAGTNGYVLTTNGNNEADWAEPNTHLYIAADTGASEIIDLLTETLTFEGSGAINTATGTNKIIFSVDTATDAILGVATFNTASFTVSAGDVTIKNAGVSNAQLVNNDVTFGTSVVALGGTSLTLAGLQQLDVDNIRIDGNTISSTNNNGNISFSPNGAGVVNLQTIKTVLSTANNDAELTTNGASDLTLTTNSGIASGFIKINTGSNGNIELTPNGTGQVLIAGVNFASFNADTYYVSHDNGLNTNNGRTSFTPFQTLKYALSVATAGDTIVLFPGEYNEVFPLTVPAGVTVRGAGIRSTTIKPTLATDDLDCFLLNGETTIEELTIKDMFYNTVNNTGYAFRFNTAATVTITTRSPYIQRVTVLNKGSTTTSSDPYGFVSGDSGRGALVDGSRVSRASLEASMLFNECTFIVPNSRALIMTNGARVEWLSCFTYFADLAIEGLVGASGRAGDGKTYVTLGGTVTGTFIIGETVRIQQSNSTTIDLSVAAVLGNTLVINGKVDSLEGVDFTPQSIIGQSSGARATAITRYDRKEFAAELRAISSANLYGNQGVRADGDDVILQLMAHNFAYIGTGFDLTNNSSTVNQANEVLESNSGIVYYNSVDQSGNFRVGDIFNANFKTGAVSFSAPVFEVNSLAGISFTDGSNITIVNPSGIQTGNINIAGNSITTDTGGIILDPIGTNNITLNSNTVISGGTLTIGAYTMPTADGNNGQALITNGNGTVSFTTISTVLTISGDSGGTDTISLLTDTLTISGTDPVQTAVTNNTITISIDNATTSAKGIASFNQDDFDVTTGAVILKDTVLKAITTDSGSLTIANHGISILGGEGLNVTHTSTTITVEGEDASDTNKGIASFSSADFTVTSGQVVLAGDVVQSVTTDSGLMTPVSNTFSILGGEGLNVTHTDTTITVEGEDASASNKGVASFSASYFTVTAGDVAINDATVNSKGVASFDTNNFTVTTGAVSAKSITLGTTVLDLGSTDLTLAGLQQLDVDNIRIDGNEISSTDADGNISLKTNGTGTIDVNSIRITNLATPIQGTDAANKNYVDAARSGLDVKQSVRAASTGPLTLSNTQTVDGVALSVGNRILVKDQNVGSQNGIYEVKNGAWTRAADFDEPFEVTAGVFFFVEEGIINADNGFVLTSNDPLIVGTDTLIFTQFSGAGQITAGDGLSKSGNTLSVNVNNSTGGIEISADAIQLMSSVAGNGLTYTDGVIAVGGTANRITISADAVDIASTYIGQTSITTLGTITTGTWNGSTVMAGFGGTGFSSYSSNDLLIGNLGGTLSKLAVGAIGKMLQVIDDGSGGAQLAYSDFDGGTF